MTQSTRVYSRDIHPYKRVGGYELLMYEKGVADQGFHQIHGPYTPSRRLRDLARQAQIYIRPL